MPGKAVERQLEASRIEGGQALIEDDEVGSLQQRARNEETAPFPMGELPSRFADHLHHASGHAREQLVKPQLVTDAFSFENAALVESAATSHQQVERKRTAEDVILVKLRRHGHDSAPALES